MYTTVKILIIDISVLKQIMIYLYSWPQFITKQFIIGSVVIAYEDPVICLPAFAKSFSVIGFRIGNHLFFKHIKKLLLQTLMTRGVFCGSFCFWAESMYIKEHNLFRLIEKFFDIPNVDKIIDKIDCKILKRFLAVKFRYVLHLISINLLKNDL